MANYGSDQPRQMRLDSSEENADVTGKFLQGNNCSTQALCLTR